MKRIVLAGVLLVSTAGLVSAQQSAQTAPAPPAPQAQPAPRPVASPPGQAATQVGGKWVAAKPDSEPRYTDGKWIVIDYGRPILRGRQSIFGAGAEYGKKVNADAPVSMRAIVMCITWPPPPVTAGVNWPLVGGIALLVLLVVAAAYGLRSRRARAGAQIDVDVRAERGGFGLDHLREVP